MSKNYIPWVPTEEQDLELRLFHFGQNPFSFPLVSWESIFMGVTQAPNVLIPCVSIQGDRVYCGISNAMKFEPVYRSAITTLARFRKDPRSVQLSDARMLLQRASQFK